MLTSQLLCQNVFRLLQDQETHPPAERRTSTNETVDSQIIAWPQRSHACLIQAEGLALTANLAPRHLAPKRGTDTCGLGCCKTAPEENVPRAR